MNCMFFLIFERRVSIMRRGVSCVASFHWWTASIKPRLPMQAMLPKGFLFSQLNQYSTKNKLYREQKYATNTHYFGIYSGMFDKLIHSRKSFLNYCRKVVITFYVLLNALPTWTSQHMIFLYKKYLLQCHHWHSHLTNGFPQPCQQFNSTN